MGLRCLDEGEPRYLSTDEKRGKVDRRYQPRDKQTKITEYVGCVLKMPLRIRKGWSGKLNAIQSLAI